MRLRHGAVLGLMFAGIVALQFIFDLPPLPATLLFILTVAIPVVFLIGVGRRVAVALRGAGAARAPRRQRWIRGAALFGGGTLAIALTQPLLGAHSSDVLILCFGLGVVTVAASYLLLVPLAVEFLAGDALAGR